MTKFKPTPSFWRLSLIPGALAAIAVLALLITRPTKYEARAFLMVPIQAPSAESALLGTNQTRSNLARIQGVAASYPVLSKVAEAHGTDVKTVKRGLEFEIDSDTSQLRIAMQHASKEKALAMLVDVVKETRSAFNAIVAATSDQTLSSLEQRRKEIQERLTANETLRSAALASSTAAGDDRSGIPILENLRSTESRIKEVEAEMAEVQKKELAALEAEKSAMASTNRIFDGKTLLEIEAEARLAAAKFAPGSVEYQTTHKTLAIAQGLINTNIENRRKAILDNASPGLKDLSGKLSGLRSQQKSLKATAGNFTGGRQNMIDLSRQIEGDTAALTQLRIGIEDARTKSIIASVGWATLQEPRLEDEPVKKPIVEMALLAFMLVSALAGALQIFWPFGKGR